MWGSVVFALKPPYSHSTPPLFVRFTLSVTEAAGGASPLRFRLEAKDELAKVRAVCVYALRLLCTAPACVCAC